ncbi:alpha/beta hydrolase family protein [Kitasatospora cineracea]|uniref:alpha/beta hydrolase family protein n=1 Tax=Kitasatospora cineracea TaxID=88074 RepID=UPI0037BB94B9
MDGDGALGVARAFAALLEAGHFDQAAALFAPPLRAVVPAEALRLAWTSETGARGGARAVGDPEPVPGGADPVRVRIPVTCADGGLTVVTSVGADGLLHGLRLDAHDSADWQAPPYAHQDRFTEREVLLGTGPLAVPGTLTLPSAPGPWPAAVLLAGGGPFDRDGTSGPNKPLKDLAWGLASRGAAVLRFDKPAFAHPGRLPADSTMADEYLPPALAAVELLRHLPGVDPGRIHLVGHSMGGKAAPRIAAADPSIAGLVLLAADAQPMHRAAVRVARHLAALTPGPDADRMVADLARKAELVDSPDLTPDTPARLLPLGFSAPYWLDLRAYDPVATAAALGRPVLILQGGRDYQVTVADDLARWRRGLAHRGGVTIRVHPDANHLFLPGTGHPSPAEYATPGHVVAEVVDEIATWLIRT